ncbi:MAG TPA: hypothetical protein VFK68_13345 [Propionibacteriaceae bacterium]|nr:hypothetical protein [Propionibacteriaceae bacterium]
MTLFAGAREPELSLGSFVVTLYEDLDAVVDMRTPLFIPSGDDDLARLGLEGFVAWLGDAWPGVRGSQEELLEALAEADPAVLRAAGLTGVELMLKLILWSRARQRLIAAVLEDGEDIAPDDQAEPTGQSPRRAIPRAGRFRRTKRVLKWISRALGHADTVLGSLASIINQAERVKEIKETVEKVSGEVSEDLDE